MRRHRAARGRNSHPSPADLVAWLQPGVDALLVAATRARIACAFAVLFWLEALKGSYDISARGGLRSDIRDWSQQTRAQ